MAHNDDAPEGLKPIIREQQAEFWSDYTLKGIKGFAIHVKVKGRAKRRILFVSETDVETVGRHLTEGILLPFPILSSLIEIKD
jgi:hypothetical protein